jgi:hypothetical protein
MRSAIFRWMPLPLVSNIAELEQRLNKLEELMINEAN